MWGIFIFCFMLYLAAMFADKMIAKLRDRNSEKADLEFQKELDEKYGSREEIKVKEENMDEERINEEKRFEEDRLASFNCMENLIREIGCIPVRNEEKFIIEFAYQGDDFMIQSGGGYVILRHLWGQEKMDDPRVPLLKEAANLTNLRFGPTFVVVPPDEYGMVVVGINWNFPICLESPHNPQMLKSMLNLFFIAKQNFLWEMDKLSAPDSPASGYTEN